MRLILSFLTLNVAGVALLIIAGLRGWHEEIWEADPSRLTIVIAVLFVFGLVLLGMRLFLKRSRRTRDIDTVRFISGTLVVLGLIGTVLGIIIALRGVDEKVVGDTASIGPMVAQLITGMGIAMYTTLVGASLSLWLNINIHLVKLYAERDEES